MVMAMKGLIPAPKGRTRTTVGHKYLEALQAKVNGESSDTSSSPSPVAEQKFPGLNLLVLGVTSGTAMDDIDFALCRFTQESPESPLCLEIVKVTVLTGLSIPTHLIVHYSTIRWSCLQKYGPISSPCYEKTQPRQAYSPRWMRKWVTPLQMPYTSLHRSTESQWTI